MLVVFGCALFGFLINLPETRQNMDSTDLRKYSYFISGDTILGIGKGHVQGTGFFIKRNDKIFFVCAKHTLSGCNDHNEKDPGTPNLMDIHLANGDSIKIDVKAIKDTAPCLPIVLDPDIFVVSIDSGKANDKTIWFVNELEGRMSEKFSELVVWGYPNNEDKIEVFESHKFSVFIDVPVVVEGKAYVDKIHYCIGIEDRAVEGLVGFSGGPVFLKDPNSEKFVFIGVMVGTHKSANGLYVVQPKYLSHLID